MLTVPERFSHGAVVELELVLGGRLTKGAHGQRPAGVNGEEAGARIAGAEVNVSKHGDRLHPLVDGDDGLLPAAADEQR